MARTPNHQSKKKRTKTVLLSEKAYLILVKLKKHNEFNFSRFVSEKLIDKYGDSKDDEVFWKNKLWQIQKERYAINEEYSVEIGKVAAKLAKVRSEAE